MFVPLAAARIPFRASLNVSSTIAIALKKSWSSFIVLQLYFVIGLLKCNVS